MNKAIQFPPDFLWGSATSAYQIEGSPLADGAGPSIWQRFCAVPGNVRDGDSGDVACDHYNRYKDDVALMVRLGLKAYRFSVSWSRILPQGRGRINQAGLDFYNKLIDELLANGIEPMVTLYHWDLPAALDDRGGWLNPDIADWFADYARILFTAFDGRVKYWATLNEPWVVTDGGYMHGTLAPGHRSLHEAALASHNLLRAHGSAVKVYREVGKHQIGIVVNIEPKYPASQSQEDLDATRRADAYMNRQYLDPVFHGRYPEELKQMFGDAWPDWPAADFSLIGQKLDFVGINYYTRAVVRNEPTHWPLKVVPVRQTQATYTETGWEVYPQGLTDTLVNFKRLYGDTPLYVMENGSAFYDPPNAEEGRIHDPLRIDCMRKNMRALSDALAHGVDVRGYMVWSLLDNLEWSLGFSKRFGIIHVNFETQQRTLKDSAYLYADIVTSNGACLNQPV